MVPTAKIRRLFCTAAPKIDFKKVVADRFENVLEHLRCTFFLEEPLSKALQFTKPGQKHEEAERYIKKTLEEGYSIMAVNEKDEIAGVMVNGVADCRYIKSAEQMLNQTIDEKFRKIITLLIMLNKKADLFGTFRIDKIFDMRFLSVDSRVRGQGVAKNLVLKSVELAQDCGFKFLKTEATGCYSNLVFKENGFTPLCTQDYDQWCDKNGEIIFKIEPPNMRATLLYKSLEPKTTEKC